MSGNSIRSCGDRLPSSPQFFAAPSSDPFLALFPHRFDYIFATVPQPGHSPSWQTERRHPLTDRLIDQSAFLYGVRFGSQTRYCLLDIDWGSAYHPRRDPLAIDRIRAALEPLGLVSSFACSSSDSGGIHLYFPFGIPLKSWELAHVVVALLEQAGFKVAPGQLEVFPNPKPYIVEGQPGLFNAHRLPLQVGSYLLDDQFEPIWSDRSLFIQQWQFCQSKNDINELALRRILKQRKRNCYRVSGKAEKFLTDLNTEIEPGWTGRGQTNYLLGRIAMRCYVFHHLLTGEPPLEGEALVDQIVAIAINLPGYKDWCNHQSELVDRATDWARSVENSHYFHYGLSKGKYKSKQTATEPDPNSINWNQQQLEQARERIRTTVESLQQNHQLPDGITARFKLLTQSGISGRSLYRHKDLWHPIWHKPTHQEPSPEAPDITTSLLSEIGGNQLTSVGSDAIASSSQGGNSSDSSSSDLREFDSKDLPSPWNYRRMDRQIDRQIDQQINQQMDQSCHSQPEQKTSSGESERLIDAIARNRLQRFA
jgi:hypothetical protein